MHGNGPGLDAGYQPANPGWAGDGGRGWRLVLTMHCVSSTHSAEDTMPLSRLITTLLTAAALTFAAHCAEAEQFRARLDGFQELGAQNNETGAILSDGRGTLTLTLDRAAGTATFTLT